MEKLYRRIFGLRKHRVYLITYECSGKSVTGDNVRIVTRYANFINVQYAVFNETYINGKKSNG